VTTASVRFWGNLKEAAGSVSLETMLTEIDKLLAVRAIGIGPGVFGDIAPSIAGWRARAAVESPSHLRTHPEALRMTLVAALLREREREITDALVDLLISTVHRVGARAEKKVTNELSTPSSASTARRTPCSGLPRLRWPPPTAPSGALCSRRSRAVSRRCGSLCTSSRPVARCTGARSRRRRRRPTPIEHISPLAHQHIHQKGMVARGVPAIARHRELRPEGSGYRGASRCWSGSSPATKLRVCAMKAALTASSIGRSEIR
jgi:hypothetical protein